MAKFTLPQRAATDEPAGAPDAAGKTDQTQAVWVSPALPDYRTANCAGRVSIQLHAAVLLGMGARAMNRDRLIVNTLYAWCGFAPTHVYHMCSLTRWG